MNKKRLQKLSDANFEIMDLIWEKGEASVNEILEAVNSRRKHKIKRESIQVQVKRLGKYGWLKRKKQGKYFYYSPMREKDETKQDILKDIKDRVFGGSHAELVRCLMENTKVSPGELKRINDFLKKYEKG